MLRSCSRCFDGRGHVCDDVQTGCSRTHGRRASESRAYRLLCGQTWKTTVPLRCILDGGTQKASSARCARLRSHQEGGGSCIVSHGLHGLLTVCCRAAADKPEGGPAPGRGCRNCHQQPRHPGNSAAAARRRPTDGCASGHLGEPCPLMRHNISSTWGSYDTGLQQDSRWIAGRVGGDQHAATHGHIPGAPEEKRLVRMLLLRGPHFIQPCC